MRIVNTFAQRIRIGFRVFSASATSWKSGAIIWNTGAITVVSMFPIKDIATWSWSRIGSSHEAIDSPIHVNASRRGCTTVCIAGSITFTNPSRILRSTSIGSATEFTMSMRGCTVSMMGPIVSERTVPNIPMNPPLFDIELKSPESPDSAISERLFLPFPLPESPSEAIVPVFVSVPSVASAVRSVLSLMEESTSVWFAASAALLISSSSGATISFRLSLNSMPISP